MLPQPSPQEQLRGRQLRNLRQMLSAILPANRFYDSKFRDAGCLSLPDSLETFFEKYPFTEKRELVQDQLAHPPHGSNLSFPIREYSRFCQTSATTGAPLRWLDTAQSWAWMLDNWELIFRQSGVSAADRVFCAFSFGPFLGFWTAFEAAARMGCLTIPGGGMSSLARLQTIVTNDVTVVCCTPTYAIRLGEVARQNGIDLGATAVKYIIVAGEPGGSLAPVYQHIEALWQGARVVDHHGMTEIGPVSYEDPQQRANLRIIGKGFIAEIIDPKTSKPVPPGEIGELVLTNLGRWGSPLIRYRTGDLVRQKIVANDSNPDMLLAGGILGRSDDMVTVRGVNIYPAAVEGVIRQFPQIAEYQVDIRQVRGMDEMEVRIELKPGINDAPAVISQVEAQLRVAFSLRIPVKPVESGTLPRFEMKAKRWNLISG